MDNWVIKDMIKRQMITFYERDKVIIFRRKSNGYPKWVKDGVYYNVDYIQDDFLYVYSDSTDGIRNESNKIHKTYMIPKYFEREIKINSILNNK